MDAITMISTTFLQMDMLQQAAAISTAICFVYAVSLAGFRHSVFEDNGLMDTIFELTRYGTNLFVSFRLVRLQGTERIVLSVCLILVSLLLTKRSYEKYVAGRVNPRKDETGKVWIVTGSNTGIGFETAKQLASMGATVILACRSLDKAAAAREEILASTGGDSNSKRVQVLKLDLCSFDSVTAFAKAFRALDLPLHGLINNAGAAFDQRQPTSGDMEATLQSNHLSHFLLTLLLLPALSKHSGRIVNVSSSVHNGCPGMRWDDLHFAKPGAYSMFPCYDQSKLANLLFTRELDKNLRAQGSKVCVVAVHPGCVRTEFTKNMAWWMVIGNMLAAPLLCTLMKNRQQGAYSTLHAALAESSSEESPTAGGVTSGGVYFHGEPYRNVSKAARNDAEAAKLWTVSKEITDSDRRVAEVWGSSSGSGGNGAALSAADTPADTEATIEKKTAASGAKRRTSVSPARTRSNGNDSELKVSKGQRSRSPSSSPKQSGSKSGGGGKKKTK